MTITALPQRFLLGLILAASTIGAGLAVEAPAKGTLTVPGPLVLTPTELVLVDGRKVQGQLACELEGHLVLYSPGLGTLASFRKEFVASYTRDKRMVMLSAPRTLSPEEQQVDLDWNGWPDAPPDAGASTAKKPGTQDKPASAQVKPAYTTQKWDPPKRLLVWKNLNGQPKNTTFESSDGKLKFPGTNFKGDIENWLVLGEPLVGDKLDRDTDIICPGAGLDKLYYVNMPDGGSIFRHLVVENYARIGFPSMNVWGNCWIHERGRQNLTRVSGVEFLGPFHTFIKNARPSLAEFCRGGGNPEATPQTWDKSGYVLAQYIGVKKDKTASVEFLGTFVSGDKFRVYSGACILGPDSSVHSDTRNGDVVYKDGSLHLMDGALLGKMKAFPLYVSLEVHGVLTAGLPDRPLTRDATIMLGKKDYAGVMGCGPEGDFSALMVLPGGQMRVHSADPKMARLVFQSAGFFDQSVDNLAMSCAPWNIDGPRYASLPKRIETTFLGDVVLDGVLFKDLHRGGIRLKDAGMTKAWPNVVFDASCQSQKAEDNYAVYQKGVPPVGWSEDPAVKNPVISPGEKISRPRSMAK